MIDADYNYPLHYVTEEWQEMPERFKQLANLISGKEDANVLDVGCAAGELIHYLKEIYPGMTFTGVDNYPLYIQKAKKLVKDADFRVASVLDLPDEFANQFDITLAMGVLGIFDVKDVELFLNNLFKCTKTNGKIIIFSHFNQYPIDVMVRHRRKGGNWERGWNIFSMATMGDYLKGKECRFNAFELPFGLEPKENNPVRTWTMETEGNQYQLTNGLKLLVNYYFLEIW